MNKTALTFESDIVTNYDFEITIVDLYTLNTSITIHHTESSKSVVLDLIRQGYLGATPEEPSIAISLCTLELYHRIRRRKASFSAEAFAKVICDLYKLEDEPPLKFS
ncbi:hypothetical protein C0992_008123 [Termitomyces sp. T32_za158]|nr:hypothetical protein C0992_008123 [Termitomyces sp. T32_za158]